MHRWMAVLAFCGIVSTCCAATIATYNAGLGTLPPSQGWALNGNATPPSSVSGGVFSYGPTTTAGTTFWINEPPAGSVDFTTGTWSLSVDLRLTGATFGSVSGFRRGGFVLTLFDKAGRWITADLGSNAISLRNDDSGLGDPSTTFNLTSAFHVVTLEAGPGGARLLVDGAEQLSLAYGSSGGGTSEIYFGEASVLASAALTEIKSAALVVVPACSGDINGDGHTNVADFNILAGHFGQTVSAHTSGDLNGNGLVNVADFNILAGDFGCGS